MALSEEEKIKRWNESHKNIDRRMHKICLICDSWFPLTEEYFYKNKSSPDGLNPYCKSCTIRKSRQRALDNHEKYLDDLKEWYIKK